MDELHQRLIGIGLRAAAEHGFALAGGYAVQAHDVVTRLSDDVDLFTSWDRRDELAAAAEQVAAAYRDAGLAVTVDEQREHYVRLQITDPATNPAGDLEQATKVELLPDLRLNPPVQMSIGPVLHRDDVAGGKMTALFSRAAARDYIDVASLLSGGHYTRTALLELAARRDGGFDRSVFAQMLAGIHRYKDEDFLRYGIERAQLDAVRAEIVDWHRELTEQPRSGRAAGEPRAAGPGTGPPTLPILPTHRPGGPPGPGRGR